MRPVVVSASRRRANRLVCALRALGHEPSALLTTRPHEHSHQDREDTGDFAPGVDVLAVRDNRSVAALLAAYQPDVAVCWGFPWLVSRAALRLPRYGWVNLHESLLPKHRGPMPVAWALRNGDPVLGVTWHRMDAGFATGPILAQGRVPLSELDPLRPWDVLAPLAFDLLPRALKRLEAGEVGDRQHEDRASCEGPFEFDEFARIDHTKTVREIVRQVAAWRLTDGRLPLRGPVLELGGEDHSVISVTAAEPRSPQPLIKAADGRLWVTESIPLGCRVREKCPPVPP